MTGGREFVRRLAAKIPRRYRAALVLAPAFLAALSLFVYQGSPNRGGLIRESAEPSAKIPPSLDRQLAAVEKRLQDNPENLKALFASGLLKFRKGSSFYPDAIADFEKARQLGLCDERLFYYLGVMYQGVGLYDFACDEYKKFLRNRGDDFEIFMRLAKLHYAAGRFPEAARDYEALRLKHPQNPLILENLALSLWKNKQDYSQPLSELRSQGGRAALRAGFTEGRICYELKDYSRTRELLAPVLSSASVAGFMDAAEACWMLGDSSMKLKDAAGARAAFSELLKINPAHEEAKSLLARLEKAAKAAEKNKK